MKDNTYPKYTEVKTHVDGHQESMKDMDGQC